MTIFDYLVLFVLVSSVIISTLRGLVKEILSLLGWIVAFVVANAYGAQLAPMLPELLPGET
ncbi:colicin V production protein, partial [Microbacterium sp. AISO3]